MHPGIEALCGAKGGADTNSITDNTQFTQTHCSKYTHTHTHYNSNGDSFTESSTVLNYFKPPSHGFLFILAAIYLFLCVHKAARCRIGVGLFLFLSSLPRFAPMCGAAGGFFMHVCCTRDFLLKDFKVVKSE